jgi:hypothetical protein
VRYRRKRGHRQAFTKLTIREILRPGQDSKVAKPARRRRKAAAEEEEPVGEAEAVETPAAEVAETADAAPKRTRRKAAAEVEEVTKEDLPKFRRTRAPKAEKAGDEPAESEPKPRARRSRAKADEPAGESKAEETE